MISQPVVDLFELSDLDKDRMEKLTPKQIYDAFKIQCERSARNPKQILIDLIVNMAAEQSKE